MYLRTAICRVWRVLRCDETCTFLCKIQFLQNIFHLDSPLLHQQNLPQLASLKMNFIQTHYFTLLPVLSGMKGTFLKAGIFLTWSIEVEISFARSYVSTPIVLTWRNKEFCVWNNHFRYLMAIILHFYDLLFSKC